MLFHYRDRDKLEVDFVLENSAGENRRYRSEIGRVGHAA